MSPLIKWQDHLKWCFKAEENKYIYVKLCKAKTTFLETDWEGDDTTAANCRFSLAEGKFELAQVNNCYSSTHSYRIQVLSEQQKKANATGTQNGQYQCNLKYVETYFHLNQILCFYYIHKI